MKDFKVGNKLTVKLSENLGELNIKRWVEVQKYMLISETGKDLVDLKKYGEEFARGFDNQSLSQMYRVHYDWLYGLSMLARGDNADQFIFALITLEDGEDEAEYGREHLKAKLDRYAKSGLKQGDVKREVENFTLSVLGS